MEDHSDAIEKYFEKFSRGIPLFMLKITNEELIQILLDAVNSGREIRNEE